MIVNLCLILMVVVTLVSAVCYLTEVPDEIRANHTEEIRH